MKYSFWLLATAGFAHAQGPAYSYYLTHVADGSTGKGTLKTAIVLANLAKSTATVTIAATRNNATGLRLTIAGLGSNNQFATKLGAGATRVLTTDGSGDGSAGAVAVGSDVPLHVSGIVSFTDLSGNVVSESGEAGVDGQNLALEYLIPVDNTSGVSSGVALYNPGPGSATVTLHLLGGPGQPSGTATVPLGPQGGATRFAGDLFPGLADFRGTMDVVSTAKVAAAVVRQNAASAAYAYLPAASKAARGMRFFFPQISEGMSSAGAIHTTFVVTNLSAKPAVVSLTLTRDDGSPFAANVIVHGCVEAPIDRLRRALDPIPCRASPRGSGSKGAVAGSYRVNVAPASSVFLETGGVASLANGAASIGSSQAVGVAGVVTARDPQGVVISETGLAPAPLGFHFVVPFQSGGGAVAGAGFFNAGRKAVTLTLNLVDPDGKSLAGPKSISLAAGARSTGIVPDFFAGATVTSGAIAATSGSPIDATLSVVSLRQKAAGGGLSVPPAAGLPMTVGGGTPATVTPVLDTAHKASVSVPPSGGSLSLTDAKGNRFTLTIPPNALLNRETITMIAITSATGVSGSGMAAGVQLEPDGLGLLQPALLKIELASPAPNGSVPFGWRSQAPGVYLNIPTNDPHSLTLALMHFSGAGVGGLDVTSDLIGIANQLDLMQSVIAYLLAQARQETLLGDEEDAEIDAARALDAFELGYDTVIAPLMELATSTDDEDIMRCAAQLALSYSRQGQLMGLDDDPHLAEIDDFLAYAFSRADQKIGDRCKKHDPTAYFEAIGVMRQGALLGIGTTIDISACPPAFELDFTSDISGVIPIGVTGTFDAVISGKIALPGGLSKTVLTQVIDPSKDLYTSFIFSGSGPESYDKFTVSIPGQSGCTQSPGATTPSTMTVKAGSDPQLSQVQYKFNAHYDPQAVTANGQQLCSFCPVYRTEPVKVELWMDPGKPAESVISSCPGGSMTIPVNFWFSGWATNHGAAGDNGFIQGWDLVNQPNLMAQKNISQSITMQGITLTEKTDLKLKPFSQQ